MGKLVPFVQFKESEKRHWSVTLSTSAGWNLQRYLLKISLLQWCSLLHSFITYYALSTQIHTGEKARLRQSDLDYSFLITAFPCLIPVFKSHGHSTQQNPITYCYLLNVMKKTITVGRLLPLSFHQRQIWLIRRTWCFWCRM